MHRTMKSLLIAIVLLPVASAAAQVKVPDWVEVTSNAGWQARDSQGEVDFAVYTPALLDLLSDIDRTNCRLGYDAWSPALRGEKLYEAAKAAAPYTAITTNADYVRLARFRYQPNLVNYQPLGVDYTRAVPFGTGDIDYPAFFAGLRDGGFDGVASYEMCSPGRRFAGESGPVRANLSGVDA